MDAEELRRRKREVEGRYGPWTAHNIHLGSGVYTMDRPSAGGSERKMRRVVQIADDVLGRPFADLRVADLGCLEGGYAVEFASRGASVVAIDGRRPNLEKAGMAKTVLSLQSLELVEDDVRNFGSARYGRFDVVLAIGILYHLDVPDVFHVLAGLKDACSGILIIDSRVAYRNAPDTYVHDGVTYRGLAWTEPTGASLSRKVLWSALGNRRSFQLTRGSLFNALIETGFTTAFECHVPPLPGRTTERATVVAINGSRQSFASCPPLDDAPLGAVPEYTLSPLPAEPPDPPRLRKSLPAAVRRGLARLRGRG